MADGWGTAVFAFIVERHAKAKCSGLHVWTTPGVQVVLLHDLTGGSIAIMCPASHEGVFVKLFHGVIIPT